MRTILPCKLRFLLVVVALFLGTSTLAVDAQNRFHHLRVAPGNAAPPPDFQYPDVSGKHYRLGDFKGQVVMLVFFATWCPSCQEEMPRLSALQKKYAGEGFTVLAVSVDRAAPGLVRRWVEQKKLGYPVLHDRGGPPGARTTCAFVPTTYLIGRDQKLLAWVVGTTDWGSERASSVIRSALLGEPTARESSAYENRAVSFR